MLLIYGKHREGKQYRPIDVKTGIPVVNIIHATMWDNSQLDWVNVVIESLNNENPDWDFEYRRK